MKVSVASLVALVAGAGTAGAFSPISTAPHLRLPTQQTSVQRTSSKSLAESNTATFSLINRRQANRVRTASSSLFSAVSGTPATPFDDGKCPFQITTPIYYVNDKPHIGHAYTSVACDVIARFMRLSGREVFFLSGTDEHGQKVEDTAAKNGVPPQEFVDNLSVSFRELLDLIDISNDDFIRTTNEDHKAAVQHLWNTLVEKEYIYLGNYEGWYSVRDECYYTESELVDGKAPTGAEVEWVVKEPSYFFKLSAFEDKLLELYESQPDFIAPTSRKNEVVSFVKGGLKDLSVSRTSFKWGIPVPGDDDHIMYVWIDALTNYISALGYPNMEEGSNFNKILDQFSVPENERTFDHLETSPIQFGAPIKKAVGVFPRIELPEPVEA